MQASSCRRSPGRPCARPLQPFVALPGVIAVLDSVVGGTFAGIAALALDLGTAASLALGADSFLVAIAGFVVYALWTIGVIPPDAGLALPDAAGSGVDRSSGSMRVWTQRAAWQAAPARTSSLFSRGGCSVPAPVSRPVLPEPLTRLSCT